ncbi:MAG TPA: hypothetical protein VK600_01360 [Candidatus Saccharimonadales bacterium]|nr:hypothetical protein [Candidatus Saccharimonadales bacterium]
MRFRIESCELFAQHCQHQGLDDRDHALLHALTRRINQVAEADSAAGLYGHGGGVLFSGGSTSSIFDDGPVLRALIREEGWDLAPAEEVAS